MKSLLFISYFMLALSLFGQDQLSLFEKEKAVCGQDWLLEKAASPAQVYRTSEGYLVLSNGLVSRTFSVAPNGATIGLEHLQTGESFLRSIRPEAEVQINGITFQVGGLTGQPIHNYLLPEWIPAMKADPLSFKLTGYRVENTKERFSWQKRAGWMSKDLPWPAPGKELIFTYGLDPDALESVKKMVSHKPGPAVDPGYLKDIAIIVHYELYDGLPVFCKWITVENKSGRAIEVNTFKSEILAVTEPESHVDAITNWVLPNITVETDYTFGGMTFEAGSRSSFGWNTDPQYLTQVSYERQTRCLLEVSPKVGPGQYVAPGETFSSYRSWELLHDSWDRERKGLEHRRMLRAMAPWVTENPVLMHVRSADNEAVKKAIDQCAEVGFEMVIMTFGSGFNLEDTTEKNLARMKELGDYAHQKGIALGGYSLLASRSAGVGNDVVMPEGMKPQFGNSPCLESKWGREYFDKLYRFYEKTGLDILEHDGSYPGDLCASKEHPGHWGLADSQWLQYKKISDFYKWCRSKGIYLNVPDYYYLSGSNKSGMGYRETNWSLPRAQQEVIERQNIYDGTWKKTPSMGWMFVPLVEYQGGGEAATIEPLKDHLPHYGQRLANLFGAGVQACYRGPQLYDSPETKAVVEKWVSFYKKHRQVLDGDIIHLRRADGRDWDGILHVNPSGTEKGLLMLYNPLEELITRELTVPVYYTGVHERVMLEKEDGTTMKLPVSRDYTIKLKVTIPAKGTAYYVLK